MTSKLQARATLRRIQRSRTSAGAIERAAWLGRMGTAVGKVISFANLEERWQGASPDRQRPYPYEQAPSDCDTGALYQDGMPADRLIMTSRVALGLECAGVAQ